MTVRTVNTLPAATHDERVRCLFAIELSKQSWVIGFNTPLSAKISRRILSGGDWEGLPTRNLMRRRRSVTAPPGPCGSKPPLPVEPRGRRPECQQVGGFGRTAKSLLNSGTHRLHN
jgi:hypothetical protein